MITATKSVYLIPPLQVILKHYLKIDRGYVPVTYDVFIYLGNIVLGTIIFGYISIEPKLAFYL